VKKFGRQVSEKVKNVISDGRLCLSLGGDHSMGVGTIDGHMQAKGELSVLWVDAHADINTNTTSQSGNVHGMPVALLAKELSDYWPYLPGLDWQVPRSPFLRLQFSVLAHTFLLQDLN